MSKPGIILITWDPQRELERRFIHVQTESVGQHEECMVLVNRKLGLLGPKFAIPLNSIYKYDDPANAQEEQDMIYNCAAIAKIFGANVSVDTLSRIQMFVQDGIQELIHMKPLDENDKPVGAEFRLVAKQEGDVVAETEGRMIH